MDRGLKPISGLGTTQNRRRTPTNPSRRSLIFVPLAREVALLDVSEFDLRMILT
jgi:hypothetical protein